MVEALEDRGMILGTKMNGDEAWTINRDCFGNWRPLTLLNFFYKILDKEVALRIRDALSSYINEK